VEVKRGGNYSLEVSGSMWEKKWRREGFKNVHKGVSKKKKGNTRKMNLLIRGGETKLRC